MENYQTNKKIDYLSLTVSKSPIEIIGDIAEKMDRSPNKNYNLAHTTTNGAIVMQSTKDMNVGTHIVMSGRSLDYIRGEGHTDRQLAKFFMKYDCKIARIDVAITSERLDGKAHELSPHAIHHLANSGHLKSQLKPDKAVLNDDNVETAYIGSRKARNRLFRAYDKGLDLGLDAMRIIRYELETRKRSNVVLNSIAEGIDIGSIIKKYVDFPDVPMWQNIINAPSVEIPHIENTVSKEEKRSIELANRWHWLITSASPALAKALYEDMQNGLSVPENILESENFRIFMVNTFNKIDELAEKDIKK